MSNKALPSSVILVLVVKEYTSEFDLWPHTLKMNELKLNIWCCAKNVIQTTNKLSTAPGQCFLLTIRDWKMNPDYDAHLN